MTDQPPTEGRYLGWLSAIKTLTVSNVLVIALLVVIAVPVYVVYKALGDEKLLDRLMSTYEEIGSQSGCTVRHLQERGGPELWGVSSGFAFQGADRWFVNVALTHEPTEEEIATYCESLKLIADRMLDRSSEIHGGSMSSPPADGGGRDWSVPGDIAPQEKEEGQ